MISEIENSGPQEDQFNTVSLVIVPSAEYSLCFCHSQEFL